MFHRAKYCLVAILLLLYATGATAHSGNNLHGAKIFYRDIKVLINGWELESAARPFMIEGSGTVMVPLRAIAEALHQEVTWIGDQGIIEVKPKTNSTGVHSPPESPGIYLEELPVLRNVGPFFQLKSRKITIASREFNHGLVVELEKSLPGPEKSETIDGETIIDLKGKYSKLAGYLGVDDETRNSRGSYQLMVFADGILKFESHIIKPADYPYYIEIDVRNVKRLSLQVKWINQNTGDYDRIWVALANWCFLP